MSLSPEAHGQLVGLHRSSPSWLLHEALEVALAELARLTAALAAAEEDRNEAMAVAELDAATGRAVVLRLLNKWQPWMATQHWWHYRPDEREAMSPAEAAWLDSLDEGEGT